MTDYLADADHIADSEVQAKAEGWHLEWLDEYRRAWGYGAYAYADANANADAYADADADADADAYARARANADADAYARANAEADADADADAEADAYAYADAEPRPPTEGIPAMAIRQGLYLFTSPSSESVAVLRVAWLRPMQGEEHEALNVVTPLRGEYKTMLSEAQDEPPKNWKWTTPLKRPSQYHRAQIRNPIALDPKGYAKVCPMPSDWVQS